MATKCLSRHGRIATRIAAILTALSLGTSQVLAQAAGWMPPAKQQFFDNNGAPLIAGQVFTYVPNTTNPKNTWQDPNQNTLNSNPVILDGSGRGLIFGQGNYRQVVQDSLGNTKWDSQTGSLGSATLGSQVNDTAPLGTVISYSGFAVPTNWLFAAGQPISRSGFPGLLTAITISSTTVTCVNTSTSLGGWVSTSQMAVGEPVEASCVPSGTTISSITNATTIVVSNQATSSTTVTGTVFPWGNGDGSTTFNVPDLRGRIFAGADAMNGTAASRLTSTFYGANASAPAVAGGSQSVTVPTTDTVNVAVTGATTIHGVSNANPAINNIQPTVTVNYIIKALPFATGLGGVTSFGGLFGDVVCGATLTCSTVAGIPTVSCTAATNSSLGCIIPDNSTIKVNGSGFLIATGTSAATSIGVGTTTISGGSSGNIVFDNAGVVGEKTVTGSGSVVLATGPTISGTVNFTGIVQSVGTNITFPPSGILVGGNDAVVLQGIITPTALAANTNNYAPTGFSTAYTLRISSSAAVNLTGIAGGASGRQILLENVGSNTITLTNLDASSSAGNRFSFTTGAAFQLRAGASLTLAYDGTATQWVATGLTPVVVVPVINVFLSGTSQTFTTPTDSSGLFPLYLRVRMVAGGGGGGAETTNNGSNGTDTSFGAWTAIHGTGGTNSAGAAGTGGTGGVNSTGTLITRISGQDGQVGYSVGSSAAMPGGIGGSSPFFGGGGLSGAISATGANAKANTGGGGQGGGATNFSAGSGGASGEYVEFIIPAPATSYTYTVGTGGVGGAAGGFAGGNGASGRIEVEAYWQ